MVLVHRQHSLCDFVILLTHLFAWEETLAETSCSVHQSSLPAPVFHHLSSHRQGMENELNIYIMHKNLFLPETAISLSTYLVFFP